MLRTDSQGQPKRILIFCAESRGLGHLRRLSVIARSLAQLHSVLIVTSERLAGDFIIPPVEYVRLPPLDTSHPARVRHWDRTTFLDQLDTVQQLRTELLSRVFEIFRPDAMITDMFALGRGCELLPHLQSLESRCLNYLVLRGVLGDERYIRSRVFSSQSIQVLRRHYKRLLIACDQRVMEAVDYGLPDDLIEKAENVGYVFEPADLPDRDTIRHARSVKPGEVWVVCAAGSGLSSEHLIEHCFEAARHHPHCRFTLVLGPHSRLTLDRSVPIPSHIEIVKHQHQLNLLLGSCDIAVIHGGYNSLLESVCSGASVLVVPNEGEAEQEQHARRLSAIADVRLSSIDTLGFDLERTLKERNHTTARPIPILDKGGADKICSILSDDLQNESQSALPLV